MMTKRALISVSDKTGAVWLAQELAALGHEIVSTGGTLKALTEAGVIAVNISEVTGFPECLDGRLKTLHPAVHGGILAVRDNEGHMRELEENGIGLIDIVAVNLYPFKKTIENKDVSLEEAIENIDIGGPTMLRAAAKNWRFVSAVCDPSDYAELVAQLKENGTQSQEFRLRLAAKVFMHTADYDAAIAGYVKGQAGFGILTDTLTLSFEKLQGLRYGENPHQQAAFYKSSTKPADGSLTSAKQLHGKELSFNNINDTHGALELLREFDEPTVVACKHSNPCGVGSGLTIHEACVKACQSDPVSVFGGIIVANREVDEPTALEISKIFIEIVLAPSFSEEALKILTRKKGIRLLELKDINRPAPSDMLDIKAVSGGILVQEANAKLIPEDYTVATDQAPTDSEMEDLIFAWKIVKHTKSNGIAIAKGKQSVGIGPGQVNRIWATKQAIEHGAENLGPDSLKGAALASDAFFPFPDCAEAAAAAGITAIIQPGGSVNDKLSIEKCNESGIAMIFTGMRHFRH
jgi:phosphoribosylaminoimidazolecarboxamide formyltransferase/IMP cyclohydrolase